MLAVVFAFVMGTFVGSFLNVCIHRLPRNESIVTPRSRCYSCGTAVAWYDNIPVVSWLALRGRCRWCGAPFSIRYLLIEAAVGVLSAGLVWLAFADNGGIEMWTPWSAPWIEWLQRAEPFAPMPTLVSHALAAASALALLYFLVVSTVTDLDYMIIPDELTKSFQVAAPFLGVLCGHGLLMGWSPLAWLFHDGTPTPGHFLAWFLGIAVGSLALLALSVPLARRVYVAWLPPHQRWEEEHFKGLATGIAWFIAATVPAVIAATLLVYCSRSEWTWTLAAGLAQAVLGALAGWISLYVVGLIGTVAFRRNAMGFGDVKFLAPIGCWLGPVGVLYVFFIAAAVGTVVGVPLRLMHARREIPFGPYLAVGALVMLAYGPELHLMTMRLIAP
jgi:leader peptidase (prepilin peptidase)/N-methyltransferase